MNRAVVRTGNPRMLIGGHVDGITAKEQNNPQLSWEVQEYPAFNNIRQIVPQNCLVGQDEAIPGLKTQTGKFPHPRDSRGQIAKSLNCNLMQHKEIYLHNLQLTVAPTFEPKFEAFLK